MNEKKREPESVEIHDEYDFRGGVRGKYAQRYAAGSNVVVIAPDIADLFPTADAVNEALRALARVAWQATRHGASEPQSTMVAPRGKDQSHAC